MKLTIRTHNTTAFDDFHERAEKRLARLDHLLPGVGDVVVEVGHEETRQAAHRYAVQVTVHAGSSILRAEERGADPRVALDIVADVLARQARRHQKRLRDRNHANVTKEAAAAAALSAPVGGPELDDEVDEYVLGRVVRAKHFEAKPMSQEEALAQMDLIGHDFFLFLDSATNDYALLYKRKDGDYGLLAPRRA
ncbi:MAG: ribosome-associated translation inhibitor RaiA [Dehalococcoidia bacterium]|nr:MAG: ribosome-associated translation inhibitor RaiA [Dehalococcoidia bacterium]